MSKHKISTKNPLQYWIDELIFFRRDFTIIVDATPEAIAAQFRTLAYEKQGCTRKRRIVVDVATTQGESNFEIKTEQPNDSGYHQSARATGVIFRDDDDRTIVQGSIKLSGVVGIWVVIIPISILMYGFLPRIDQWDAPLLMFQVIFAIVMVMTWVQSYNDRNYLHEIIKRAVEVSRFK